MSQGSRPAGIVVPRKDILPGFEIGRGFVFGDVSILCSNRIQFFVPSSTLAWSCNMFNDRIEQHRAQPLDDYLYFNFAEPRADSTFSGRVISAFLNLITLNFEELDRVFSEPHPQWTRLLQDLIRFLNHTSSERGVKLLRMFGAQAVASRRFSELDGLVFAARTNDLALCYRVLLSAGNERSSADKTDRGESRISLGAQSYETARSIPLPYQWAIARATSLIDRRSSPEQFAHKVVELVLDTPAQNASGEHPD